MFPVIRIFTPFSGVYCVVRGNYAWTGRRCWPCKPHFKNYFPLSVSPSLSAACGVYGLCAVILPQHCVSWVGALLFFYFFSSFLWH